MAAASINPEQLVRLKGSKEDIGNPEYESLKQRLTAMRLANNDCRFVYIVVFRGKDVVFLADSEPPSSPDYSPPGQVYTEASDIMRESLHNGQNVTEGPYADRWGVWVSSFAPILNPQSHQVVALMGQDTEAGYWQRNINRSRLAVICVILLIALLAIAFFGIQQKKYESAELSSFLNYAIARCLKRIPHQCF